MAILAIDSGLRRIGLAIAHSTDSPAYPLGTLKRSSLRIDLKQIAAWIDGRGVPVQFSANDDGGIVTFTLTHCSGCDVFPVAAAQQVGMR